MSRYPYSQKPASGTVVCRPPGTAAIEPFDPQRHAVADILGIVIFTVDSAQEAEVVHGGWVALPPGVPVFSERPGLLKAGSGGTLALVQVPHVDDVIVGVWPGRERLYLLPQPCRGAPSFLDVSWFGAPRYQTEPGADAQSALPAFEAAIAASGHTDRGDASNLARLAEQSLAGEVFVPQGWYWFPEPLYVWRACHLRGEPGRSRLRFGSVDGVVYTPPANHNEDLANLSSSVSPLDKSSPAGAQLSDLVIVGPTTSTLLEVSRATLRSHGGTGVFSPTRIICRSVSVDQFEHGFRIGASTEGYTLPGGTIRKGERRIVTILARLKVGTPPGSPIVAAVRTRSALASTGEQVDEFARTLHFAEAPGSTAIYAGPNTWRRVIKGPPESRTVTYEGIIAASIAIEVEAASAGGAGLAFGDAVPGGTTLRYRVIISALQDIRSCGLIFCAPAYTIYQHGSVRVDDQPLMQEIPARFFGDGEREEEERYERANGKVPRTVTEVRYNPFAMGNANDWRLYDCLAGNCGVGLHPFAAESSCGVSSGFRVLGEPRIGIYDSGFFGSLYLGTHIEGEHGGSIISDGSVNRSVFVYTYKEVPMDPLIMESPSLVLGGPGYGGSGAGIPPDRRGLFLRGADLPNTPLDSRSLGLSMRGIDPIQQLVMPQHPADGRGRSGVPDFYNSGDVIWSSELRQDGIGGWRCLKGGGWTSRTFTDLRGTLRIGDVCADLFGNLHRCTELVRRSPAATGFTYVQAVDLAGPITSGQPPEVVNVVLGRDSTPGVFEVKWKRVGIVYSTARLPEDPGYWASIFRAFHHTVTALPAPPAAATSHPTRALRLAGAGGSGLTLEAGSGCSNGRSQTVEMWLRLERRPDSGQRQYLYQRQIDVDGGLYVQPSGDIGFQTGNAAGSDRYFWVTGIEATPGAWIHIAVVTDRQASEVRIYRNGAIVYVSDELGKGDVNPDYANKFIRAPVLLGGGTSGKEFAGSLAEVRIWLGVRTLGEIAGAMSRRLTATERSSPALLAYLPLDEGSGAQARELVGAGAALVLGGTWLTEGPPLILPPTGSLRLSGDGEVILAPPTVDGVAQPSSLATSGSQTTEAWLYLDSLPSAGTTMTIYQRQPDIEGRLFIDAQGAVRFVCGDRTGSDGWTHYKTADGVVRAGAWMHVAQVMDRDRDVIRIFVNGGEVEVWAWRFDPPRKIEVNAEGHGNAGLGGGNMSEAPGGYYASKRSSPARIGSSLKGRICEVRVWRGVRTEQQIRETMNRPLTAAEASGAAMLGYLPLTPATITTDLASGGPAVADNLIGEDGRIHGGTLSHEGPGGAGV